jgi:hypothetical protein
MNGVNLTGWMPIQLLRANEGPRVDWSWRGDVRFTEPFFEQTISRALRDPARMLFRRVTPMEVLESESGETQSLRPTGFIFHWSRCGSTLIAQMLAALRQCVVISEAPPIDQVLALQHRDPRVTRAQRLAWFHGMIAALGQRQRTDERHYFVKFDSWHTQELPLILEAFPDVPSLFLYRDPVEIMVSQQRLRGIQMMPQVIDPARFGLDASAAKQLSPDEYCVRVLARVASAALAHLPIGRSRFVNFSELPEVVWQSLGQFFGIEWSAEDLAALALASKRNAKVPGAVHADDRAEKQQAASAELRQLAETWLGETYRRLEERRLAQTRAVAAAASASNLSRSQSFTMQSMTR